VDTDRENTAVRGFRTLWFMKCSLIVLVTSVVMLILGYGVEMLALNGEEQLPLSRRLVDGGRVALLTIVAIQGLTMLFLAVYHLGRHKIGLLVGAISSGAGLIAAAVVQQYADDRIIDIMDIMDRGAEAFLGAYPMTAVYRAIYGFYLIAAAVLAAFLYDTAIHTQKIAPLRIWRRIGLTRKPKPSSPDRPRHDSASPDRSAHLERRIAAVSPPPGTGRLPRRSTVPRLISPPPPTPPPAIDSSDEP
jgi:hypothetical protein